ncbi:MAG: carboxypeptidase regulatory-like domain-containing protein [Acidobacteriaceae bacterium]
MKSGFSVGLCIPAILAALACSPVWAQSPRSTTALPDSPPDSPGALLVQETQSVPAAEPATVFGTVTTAGGDTVVIGAVITLQNSATHAARSATSTDSGFFSFTDVPAGSYTISVKGQGFEPWTSSPLDIRADEYCQVARIVLKINTAASTVLVTASTHQVAELQLESEEKQRILGVIPNFFVSYVPDAAPLSAGQKARLASRDVFDPVSFITAGITAGIEQGENVFPAFGQGSVGFAKRYGAAFADNASSDLVGNALLPVLFRQDPRFYYHGGSVRSRALYAIATVFICKGDNGRWQPNYSFVLGGFAAASVSNLYYPAAERGGGLVVTNGLLNLASGAGAALLEEFVFPKITSRGKRRAQGAGAP